MEQEKKDGKGRKEAIKEKKKQERKGLGIKGNKQESDKTIEWKRRVRVTKKTNEEK